MQSKKYGVPSTKYGVEGTEYGVQRTKCEIAVQGTIRLAQNFIAPYCVLRTSHSSRPPPPDPCHPNHCPLTTAPCPTWLLHHNTSPTSSPRSTGLPKRIGKRPAGRAASLFFRREKAKEVMVTGDIHGHRRNFNLIRRAAALDRHARRHLVLQEACHGGPNYWQNGGCMSHTILEDIAAMKVTYPDRVHFLLGNHELAEMTDYPIQKNRLLLNFTFRLGLQQMYGPAAEQVREALLRFLWSCPLALRLPHGVFISHSLPEATDARVRSLDPRPRVDPGRRREQADVFRLLWGRDYRRENAKAFAKLVGAQLLITGHEPCQEGFVAPNDLQVILDCCGDKAAYALLPVGPALSHAEIMERVKVFGE